MHFNLHYSWYLIYRVFSSFSCLFLIYMYQCVLNSSFHFLLLFSLDHRSRTSFTTSKFQSVLVRFQIDKKTRFDQYFLFNNLLFSSPLLFLYTSLFIFGSHVAWPHHHQLQNNHDQIQQKNQWSQDWFSTTSFDRMNWLSNVSIQQQSRWFINHISVLSSHEKVKD